MGRRLLALCSLAACNAKLNDPPREESNGDVDAAVGSVDAAEPDALVLGPWSAPAKVPAASSATLNEDDSTLSHDGLQLVFAIANAQDGNRKDLYLAKRATTSAAFMTSMKLPFSATGSSEETPRFSTDDLTLYFASDRAGGAGGLDIYKATRPTTASMVWSAPAAVVGPNSAAAEKWFMPCGATNDYVVIVGGGIAAGTLPNAPVLVTELDSPTSETGPYLDDTCTTIYFASPRSGTSAIWTAHRATIGAPWSTPVMITDFATLGGAQEDPFVSADQRTFVFAATLTGGTKDVYISTR